MKLSKQAIRDFQRIYEDECGQAISVAKANRLGINLLNLMKLIYRRIPVKQDGDQKNGKQN